MPKLIALLLMSIFANGVYAESIYNRAVPDVDTKYYSQLDKISALQSVCGGRISRENFDECKKRFTAKLASCSEAQKRGAGGKQDESAHFDGRSKNERISELINCIE
jgi:hypothetical protein